MGYLRQHQLTEYGFNMSGASSITAADGVRNALADVHATLKRGVSNSLHGVRQTYLITSGIFMLAAELFRSRRADQDQEHPSRNSDVEGEPTQKTLNLGNVISDTSSNLRKGKGKCADEGKGKCADEGKGKCADEGKGKTKPLDIMRDLADNTCTKMALALLAGLKLPFSDRHNAMYGLQDMYEMLLSVCSREGGESSVEGQHQRSKMRKNAKTLASRSWVLDILRAVRHDHMLTRCSYMITRQVLLVRRRGMLRQSVDVSIDMHDIPLYAKVMSLVYSVRSKSKSGTCRFNRLATIHCVVNGSRLTLGVVLVRPGDSTADVVEDLLDRCDKHSIRISSLTMDRGFHSVDVIEAVKARGIRMTMPAIKNDRIKKIIEEHDAGKVAAISPHTIKSSEGKEATYTLVIIKREEPGNKEEKAKDAMLKKGGCVVDQYYVFATTMPDDWIDNNPERVAGQYRMRWGIENSYKCYEQMRPRTTTTDLSVRILFLLIPFIFYNLWILAAFIALRDEAWRTGRMPCTLSQFTSMLLDSLIVDYPDAQKYKPPD